MPKLIKTDLSAPVFDVLPTWVLLSAVRRGSNGGVGTTDGEKWRFATIFRDNMYYPAYGPLSWSGLVAFHIIENEGFMEKKVDFSSAWHR